MLSVSQYLVQSVIMSKDNSQWPELSKSAFIADFDLKQIAKILQSGGRITRSKKSHPISKPPENRHKDKNKTLLRYEGQPSLEDYIKVSSVKYEEYIKNDYFINKKMKRLTKLHIPESCVLFEKSYGNTYNMKQVRHISKKVKPTQFIVEQIKRQLRERDQPNKMSTVRSINAQDSCVLTTSQTLLFLALTFEEFTKNFSGPLLDLKKKYRTMKLEEVAQMQLNQDKGSQQPQSQVFEGNLSGQLIQEDKNKGSSMAELKSEEEISLKEVSQQESLQILNRINQQLNELDHKIFSKLSKGQSIMLWPCVVLQPLNVQKRQFQKLIDNCEQMQMEGSKGDTRLDIQIMESALEQILFSKADEQSENNIESDEQLQKKIKDALLNAEKTSRQPTTIHLLGTQRCQVVLKNFLKWEQLLYEQSCFLLQKSPLRLLIQELNIFISSLNKFRGLENSAFEGRNSFYRLSKYETDPNDIQLCIPVRYEQVKEEKRVLVRLIRDDFEFGNEYLLKWVQMSKLKVNLTTPKHCEEEQKFYYILGNQISAEEGLNYIFRDFYYDSVSFIDVLRQCYPKYELKRTNRQEQRCIYCYYRIDKLPCYRCKYCLKFCHQECSPTFRLKHSDTDVEQISIDIYETNRDDQVWQCLECSPCQECGMAVNKDHLKCSVCSNLFHGICGKLKGTNNDTTAEAPAKYTCQNCLKCRMCSNKLKNQEYVVDGKNIFCTKCHKDFKNDEYCVICMKQVHGKWIQCDKKECKKWIHIFCDSYFKDKQTKEALDKANYYCPNCRLKERRKVIKWVVQDLKYFDEYQYFYDPEYEEITGYKEVISKPICIYSMRQKMAEGSYDQNTYELIKADLELVVKNALTFNMPKDQPHYRAKVLLITGTKFLETMKDILEPSQEFLINGNLLQTYKKKRKDFYADLYENFLSYLLNFRLEKTRIDIKKVSVVPQEHQIFSSKYILNNFYCNAEFKFRIKKKPHKIENLFTIPRLSSSAWWPIRTRICYYHPDKVLSDNNFYQCPTCHQSYCCTKICFNHRVCSSCNIKGCSCDNYQCGCPLLRDKEKKSLEGKISSALSGSKLQKRQYSEYYKYCPRCVVEHVKNNWCHYCRNYCYCNYEKCTECNKIYHLTCENKNKNQQLEGFFGQKQVLKNHQSSSKLPGLCHGCSRNSKNLGILKEMMIKEIKRKAIKLNTIQKYLPIFNFIYNKHGIRITSQQIISLVYQNYTIFLQKEPLFAEFLVNFATIIEANENNKLARQEFRDHFMNEVNRKLLSQSSHSHERCVNFVQTKDMKELKQSKKFFKIFSKWFSVPWAPSLFTSTYDIKYYLEHLTTKLSHSAALYFSRDANKYTFHINEQQLVATSFREENHFNYKNLQRIKIEVITSYVSPKSKKNIYYTNKAQKFKTYLNFRTQYHHYKDFERQYIMRHRDSNGPNSDEQKQLRLAQREGKYKEYERYLRFYADNQSLQDSIYKQQSSRSLLFESHHRDNFNPFHEHFVSNSKPFYIYKQENSSYVNSKSEMLVDYLKAFCLKIYEENKVVLKKGNTCILSEGKHFWRILKTYQKQTIQIKLEKIDPHWILSINQWSGIVRQIGDILVRVKQICPQVSSFEDLAEFLGFNITDSVFYEPNHFTHLLQTLPLDELNRKERRNEVIKVYDTYKWHRQGHFSIQKEEEGGPKDYYYNVTKKDIFYLKKRKHQNKEEDEVQPKVVPFITFEDIKKDLADAYVSSSKERDNFIMREPTNDVYVAPSKIDRLGLFIRNFTKKNTIVTEYIGEIISEAMADVRQKKFHFGCYMFGLTKNNTRFQIIDATFTGNMGRYLNHSCDPNCKARIEIVNGQPRIMIYTKRDLQANEELTYDYQFKIDVNERLSCKCKAPNCQGRLT